MDDWELLKKLKKVAQDRSPWRLLEDAQSASKLLEEKVAPCRPSFADCTSETSGTKHWPKTPKSNRVGLHHKGFSANVQTTEVNVRQVSE